MMRCWESFLKTDAYRLPSDIEAYLNCVDSQLMGHLRTRVDSNAWAKRITEKHPYRILAEFHSGMPATPRAKEEQEFLFGKIRNELESQKVHFLDCHSTGELSRYFKGMGANEKQDPIFVRYANRYSAATFVPLSQCTDLFERYRENRLIRRIYVSPEDHAELSKHGLTEEAGAPFRFER